MRELDDIDRRLDLARLSLSSTPDARARVRDRLAARGAFSRAGALANPRHGVPTWVSAALVGVSLAAGYWLRDIQGGEPGRALPSVVDPAASADAPPSPAKEASSPRIGDPPPAFPAQPDGVGPETRVERQVVAPVASRNPQRGPAAAPSERRPSARHPSSAPTSRGAVTSGELALMRRAERAIRAGDPALALLLLDQLERDYPRSALGEERAAARILVECARAGDLAQPEAVRFLEKQPSSVYSDRIIRACRLEAPRPSESSTDVLSDGH